jgi:hypothetical protein
MVSFAVVLVSTALRTGDPIERVKRILGLFLGAMIVLGAQVSGVSFAIFTVGALATGRVVSAGAAFVSTVVPALTGLGLGFFMVRVFKKNEARALRMLCFLGMLALVAFIEVYASATGAHGVFLGAAALPNLSFAAGVGLIFVFGEERKDGRSLVDRGLGLGSRFWNRNKAKPAATTSEPRARAQEPSASVHDPFDF